jgi:Trypsin-co-occurring domain 2
LAGSRFLWLLRFNVDPRKTLLMGVGAMGGLELASVVRQLRAELNEAMDEAEGERLRFELGPVELSLTVTVGREATPGAKIRFWVIEAGADAKISREAAQDIKLVLTPRDMSAPRGPDGKPIPPLIAGKQVEEED